MNLYLKIAFPDVEWESPVFKINHIYFWLCWVSTAVCGLSLVAKTGGYSLAVVWGLPTEVASLVVEHGL